MTLTVLIQKEHDILCAIICKMISSLLYYIRITIKYIKRNIFQIILLFNQNHHTTFVLSEHQYEMFGA